MSTEEILGVFDFSQIDGYLEQNFGKQFMGFGELVSQMMNGTTEFDISLIVSAVKEGFLYGFRDGKNIFISLLILGIVGVLFNNAAELFMGNQTMNLAKYLILLVMTLFLLKSFDTAVSICESALGVTTNFMRILLPLLCLSLGFTNGSLTAYSYYILFFIVIFVIQNVLTVIFIPCAKCYIFVAFMNHLSEERRFQGVLNLLEKGITMGLKGIMYITIGSGLIQSVLAVSADHVNKTLVKKTISAIPGIGNITDSATDVLLSCTNLIKNGLGVSALIIMLLLCMTPLLKLFFLYFSVMISATLLEVMGEKKLNRYIEQTGKGYLFLFRIAIYALFLFMLSIAVLISLSKGGT